MCVLIKGLQQPNNWFIILLSPLRFFHLSTRLCYPFPPITHPVPKHRCCVNNIVSFMHRGVGSFILKLHNEVFFYFYFAVCADVTAHVCEELVSLLPLRDPRSAFHHPPDLERESPKSPAPLLLFQQL